MNQAYLIEVQLAKLERLKQHEEVDPAHLKELKDEIEADGILKFAIVVDERTNVILDGVHRFNALKELRCKSIPVVYVGYDSPAIEVQGGRGNPHLTKEDVIKAGLGERKLPPKTSKHMVRIGDTWHHISTIEKRVDIPLERLR